MHVNLNDRLPDYELLDSGNGRKLERFGKYILDRPEPGSKHKTAMPATFWNQKAHARFTQTGRTSGKWENINHCPESWNIPLNFNSEKLDIELRLSGFKHVGMFPEQVLNWDYILQQAQKNHSPSLLNLFGYTGVMSLVAAKTGCHVTHVEALKQLNQWGKENMIANHLDGIRWITDDAVKFCEKENRRQRKYDFVVLDPPAFGVARKGKPWQFQKDIYPLMKTISSILKPAGEVILNMYAHQVDVNKLCQKIEEQTGLLIQTNHHVTGVSDHGTTVDHGFIIRMKMP